MVADTIDDGNHEVRRVESRRAGTKWRGALLSGLAYGAFAMTLGATQGRSQSFAEIDVAVRGGIEKGIYPGAVVIVGRRDSLLYARGYGHFTWSPSSPVPNPDSTIWDIASITKIVSTT